MKKTTAFLIIAACSVMSFSAFAEWVEVKKWDLQVYSDTTWLNLANDTANWKPNGASRFDNKVAMRGTLKADSINIVEMDGIHFPYLDQANFSIRRGLGLQLGSNNQEVRVSNRTTGEKIEIVLSSSNKNERGISGVDNMLGVFGNTVGDRTFTFTVINTGDISFTYSTAGGIILKSIAVYKDDADPSGPALYRISGAKEQSIYAKQPVADIVYNWGNTAVSATVEWTGKTPSGITVTADEKAKTVTISGTPTQTGVYEYTVAAADSAQSTSQTGIITVNALPAGKKFIAYITDNAVPGDAFDIAILEKLRRTYTVDIVPANDTMPASAFGIYDAIVLAPRPGSSTVPTCLKGIDKPFVSLKPYMFNLWGWGTLVNLEAASSENTIKDVPASVTVSNATHPVFAGLKTSAGKEIKLVTGSKHARFRILTPVFSWTGENEANIITLATTPSGKYNYTVSASDSGNDASGKPVVFEIKPGSEMSDGTEMVKVAHKAVFIGISEQTAGYLTPEFLTIVKNAVDYVLR